MAHFMKYSLRALCLCMLATAVAWGYLAYQDLNSSRNRYANLPDDPTGGTQMSTPGSMERIDRTFDAVSDSALQDYAFELVSWSQWKTEHPDGRVLADHVWE